MVPGVEVNRMPGFMKRDVEPWAQRSFAVRLVGETRSPTTHYTNRERLTHLAMFRQQIHEILMKPRRLRTLQRLSASEAGDNQIGNL